MGMTVLAGGVAGRFRLDGCLRFGIGLVVL